MSSLANWYNNQYGVWRRTRHLSTAPFLANSNTVVNPTQQSAQPNTLAEKAANGAPETLFGPSLGAVAQAPEWTKRLANGARGKVAEDELTPEIVRAWVQKSKDKTQPTTTLQALVNLKRPTLKLSPLAHEEGETSHAHAHAHAIEFEYDADVPKCGVTIHVLPANDRGAPVQVYEHILNGGFGKHLGLEDDAIIELTKFELTPESKTAEAEGPAGTATPGLPASTSETMLATPATGAAKRRFSSFHFRKPRRIVANTAGPALQVVDVDAQRQHGTEESGTDGVSSKEEVSAEEGVRVIIKLEALDHNERALASVNTQTTYLHVVRLGSKPESSAESEDDIRPWVVKVVKREATIGFHTFHLHEIYAAPAAEASYEFAGQECVLCLSSPREVVLLPCRHLVACRDCALNMIEFGAGGQLNQATEPTAPAEGTETIPASGDAAAAAPVPTPTPRQRKRKPKGWFCPVCRQPYTSLLRITTTPPDAKQVRDSEDGEEGDIGTILLLPPGSPLRPAVTPAAVLTPSAETEDKTPDLPDDAVVIPVLTATSEEALTAEPTNVAAATVSKAGHYSSDAAQMV
ncbi:hypothetical protein BKA62DRAFT_719105 [Auriculariales sp. MPI-PUGE-AT-0066]|nr:hypothetical protein BKA62DRAFT_719105 [Auriculariales sp. MPI-PUGE-AT-0066]